MTLGERLRRARDAAKVTRREASIALDVTEETIRAWEEDEGPGPRVAHADRICRLYGVRAEWLVLGRGAMTTRAA